MQSFSLNVDGPICCDDLIRSLSCSDPEDDDDEKDEKEFYCDIPNQQIQVQFHFIIIHA